MATTIADLIARLTGDVMPFLVEMDKAKAAGEDFSKKNEGWIGSVAKLAAGAAAGMALVAAAGVKSAMEFDATMTRINTQDAAGLTKKQMDDLKQSVIALGGQTAQSPQELADAMIHVYGSGLKGAAALDLLRVAAEGATVGHANLVDVTNALDSAVAVGIKGTGDYHAAMGELNAVVGAGDMTMQNLADALGGPMLATVKTYGLSLTDVGAGLAVFGDRNIRGAEAATELRVAAQSLAVPAKTGASALKSIGLGMDDLNNDLQKGGLKLALNDLNDHLLKAGYNSTTSGKLITEAFGKKAGGGLSVLMDSLASSTSNFNDKFKLVGDEGKQFTADWAATQDTLAFKMKALGSTVEGIGIQLGNWLIPPLIKFVDLVQKGIGPAIKDLAGIFDTYVMPVLRNFVTGIQTALSSDVMHRFEAVAQTVFTNVVSLVRNAITIFDNLWHAVQPTVGLLAGLFLATLVRVSNFLKNDVGPAVVAVSGFLRDHAQLIKFLSEVVLAGFIAKLVYTKALLAADMFLSFTNGAAGALTSFGALIKSVANGTIFDTLRWKGMLAAESMGKLGTATKGAAVEAKGMAVATAGWSGGLAMSLPIIGAAMAGIGYLADKLGKAWGVGDKLTVSMEKLNTQMLGFSTQSPQSQAALVNLGTKMAWVNQTSGLSAQNMKAYDQALAQLVSSGHGSDATAIVSKLAAATDAHGKKLVDITRDLPQYQTALDQQTNSEKANALAVDGSSGSLYGNATAMSTSMAATIAAKNAQSDLNGMVAAFSTTLQDQQSLDSFNSSLLNLTQSEKDNGDSLKNNTTSGLANRQAISAAAQQIQNYYQQQVNAGDSIPQATAVMNDQISTLETTATKVYGSKKAVDDYLVSLGLIKPGYSSTVDVDITKAQAKLNTLNKQLGNTGGDPTHGLVLSNTKLKAFADGGFVDGPMGAPQLAIVHGGEFVVTASDMAGVSAGGSNPGSGIRLGSGGVSITFNVQGSVIAERDLRDLVQTLMLQLGARYSSSYTPYKR